MFTEQEIIDFYEWLGFPPPFKAEATIEIVPSAGLEIISHRVSELNKELIYTPKLHINALTEQNPSSDNILYTAYLRSDEGAIGTKLLEDEKFALNTLITYMAAWLITGMGTQYAAWHNTSKRWLKPSFKSHLIQQYCKQLKERKLYIVEA